MSDFGRTYDSGTGALEVMTQHASLRRARIRAYRPEAECHGHHIRDDSKVVMTVGRRRTWAASMIACRRDIPTRATISRDR